MAYFLLSINFLYTFCAKDIISYVVKGIRMLNYMRSNYLQLLNIM